MREKVSVRKKGIGLLNQSIKEQNPRKKPRKVRRPFENDAVGMRRKEKGKI